MNKKLLLAVLVAVLAPALWLGSSGSPGSADHNLGFGQKLAGGWLAVIDVGYPVEVLMSFSADGGLIGSGQLRWAGPDGTGGWMGTRYNTTSHGYWKRTGPNQIDALALLLIQDNDGNVVMYEKIMMQGTMNQAGTRLESSGLVHLLLTGNDPLDPEAPVFLETPITATLRRIR